MSQNTSYAFFKGNFVPLEEANLNVMNSTFLYGIGVFEGIRGYWDERKEEMYVFRMREHFERMLNSMRIIYMESRYSVEELCNLTVELLKRNAPRIDTYIRASAYTDRQRIGVIIQDDPTEICLLSVAFGDYYKGHGSSGLKTMVSSWRRIDNNAIPNRKLVGSYVNCALAKTEALKAGYNECILLTDSGHVSEGSAANIFLVNKGKLITPPTWDNILEGITRASIIELAEAEFGIKTQCRSIERNELYVAEELFFAGTGSQIAPIISVDSRPIGSGEAGPITSKLRDLYQAVTHGDMPKYYKWLTPVYEKQKLSASSAKSSSKTCS